MSLDWTEKYRPRSLKDVLGNPGPVSDLRAWAESWDKGIPKKRAVVLIGTPGVGKTTCAEALANEYGWGLIEMNASDQRTGEAIRSVALRGAYSNTFSDSGEYLNTKDGGRKLIILDEADSLFGNADRGAVPVIAELIKQTKQPVILIVNDFYGLSRKSSAIKTDTLQLTFKNPPTSTIVKALKRICISEKVDITDGALENIAKNSNGDIRAAVRDLESLALGKSKVTVEDTEELSGRIVKKNMYDLMKVIFWNADAIKSREMVRDIDEGPNMVMLWVDENLPRQYIDRGDLYRGYGKLSKADIFLGRVNRRQYYGMWSYALDMMTSGVCVARMTNKKSSDWFKNPAYLTKLSRSKGIRQTKDVVCQKLADHLHTSTKRVALDVLPPLRLMLEKDPELRAMLVRDADLDADDLAFLLNSKVDSAEVKDALNEAISMKEKRIHPKGHDSEEKAEDVPKEEKPQPKKRQKSLFEF